MPHRKIIDAENRTWEVWEVIPIRVAEKVDEERRRKPRPESSLIASRIVVPQELEQGWLAFQSEAERRRIIPIPEGWAAKSDAELVELLGRATRIADARMGGGD